MLRGSYVALVTPFKNKEIDYNSLEKLIAFHLSNKTDGILLCGTTAESPALAGDEKEQLIRFAMNRISGKIPVMVGTGTNNLHQTISSTIKAQELGADYALVITPYYNKPTQKGMYEFFKTVVSETDIPIVIYNVPGRTGVNMNSDTTIKLAQEFKEIVGIKEATGNLVQASEITRSAPHDFSVMSGEDALNLPLYSCGVKGAISVTANIIPSAVHDIWKLHQLGKVKEAMDLHLHILELNRMMFLESNPIPVKESLAMMEMIELEFRMPMCPLLEENRSKLRKVLQKYNLIEK